MKEKSVSKVSRSTREMLRKVCRTSPHPQHPAVPPKKKQGKSKRQSQYIAPGQNTLHVGAAVITVQSDSLAGLTNHGFNVCSSNAVNRKNCKIHHDSSWAETNTTVAGGATTNFLADLIMNWRF